MPAEDGSFWVLVISEPATGYRGIGLFEDRATAWAYAQLEVQKDEFWSCVPVTAPNEERLRLIERNL